MDWKYQQFERAALFHAERESVRNAAQAFVVQSLAGWRITETAEGFQATGHCGSHEATAGFRIESVPAGTEVTIKLLVERAGPLGFMLFDVGGYYNGTMFHWLEGIGAQLQQSRLPPGSDAATALAQGKPMPSRPPSRWASCSFGCVSAFLIFAVGSSLFAAVVGLVTGNLYLARNDRELHGPWA